MRASTSGPVERVAIVGGKKWQEWLAALCKPVTRATVRYFYHQKLAEARAWVEIG